MDHDSPAVIAATIHTMRTRVDGTISVTLEVSPADAMNWVRAFGTMPGTPVAVARLTNQASMQAQETKRDAEQSWGHVYTALHKLGWFHNPTVAHAFGVSMKDAPSVRIDRIKRSIYDEFGVESMADLEPQYLVAMCDALGVHDTLPASVIEAAQGRSL